MVSLNWLEWGKNELVVEIGPSTNRRVIKEVIWKPKATISAGVILCRKYECVYELEIASDKQNRSTSSVFDKINESPLHTKIPVISRNTTMQKTY